MIQSSKFSIEFFTKNDFQIDFQNFIFLIFQLIYLFPEINT